VQGFREPTSSIHREKRPGCPVLNFVAEGKNWRHRWQTHLRVIQASFSYQMASGELEKANGGGLECAKPMRGIAGGPVVHTCWSMVVKTKHDHPTMVLHVVSEGISAQALMSRFYDGSLWDMNYATQPYCILLLTTDESSDACFRVPSYNCHAQMIEQHRKFFATQHLKTLYVSQGIRSQVQTVV
jgi:hypothetical protein